MRGEEARETRTQGGQTEIEKPRETEIDRVEQTILPSADETHGVNWIITSHRHA